VSEGFSIRGDDKSLALSATGAAAKSARITQRVAGIAVINRASIAKPSCNTRTAKEKGSRNLANLFCNSKEIKTPKNFQIIFKSEI